MRTTILDEDFGHFVLKVSGAGAGRTFAGEAGKHCVQRVPANDRSGRRQTSFVNVAVLPLPPEHATVALPAYDLEIKTQTGKKGPGGQNKNKVASAVRMKHIPTGLSVFIDGRDQGANRREALRILTAKVNSLREQAVKNEYARTKASQLDDRGRGGKVRTYNFVDNFVCDHNTGRKTSNLKGVLKGCLELVK